MGRELPSVLSRHAFMGDSIGLTGEENHVRITAVAFDGQNPAPQANDEAEFVPVMPIWEYKSEHRGKMAPFPFFS
eukprot:7289707-Lingulodinium_polyedra.AAC.1